MVLQDMKISTRLSWAFAAVVSLIVLLGAIALIQIGKIGNELELTVNYRFPKVMLVVTIRDELNNTARAMRNLFIMTDPADLKDQFDEIEQSSEVIKTALAKLEETITSDQGKAKLGRASLGQIPALF